MGACRVTSKVGLVLLGALFWAAAGSLIFVGGWVYNQYRHYDQLRAAELTLIPATVLLGVGILLLVLGLIGCIGACKEQKCLLATFFTVMLFIMLAVVSAGALGYIFRHEIDKGIHKSVQDGLDKYGNGSVWTDQVDFWQQTLKCCGIDNATVDWQDTPWGKQHPQLPYPSSCCMNNTCHYGKNDTQLYDDGCLDKLKSEFLGHLAVIAAVAVAFATIQILGMICACVLICRKQPQNPYIGLSNSDLNSGGYTRA